MLFFISGYLGLFIGSFIASTLVPLSSEALLLGSYAIGLNIPVCLAVATIGNFLGGMTNYYIGYRCNDERLIRKFRFNKERIMTWEQRFSRWGA